VCLFITAVVPSAALTDTFLELSERHRVGATLVDNASILTQLSKDERYLWVTRGQCDCGSRLFGPSFEQVTRQTERQVAKLRKKGWGESKIDKWLASTKPGGSAPKQASGVHSIEEWALFLDEALSLKSTKRFGLIGHWYSGGVPDEAFELQGREPHDVSELRASEFHALSHDVIHEYRAASS